MSMVVTEYDGRIFSIENRGDETIYLNGDWKTGYPIKPGMIFDCFRGIQEKLIIFNLPRFHNYSNSQLKQCLKEFKYAKSVSEHYIEDLMHILNEIEYRKTIK